VPRFAEIPEQPLWHLASAEGIFGAVGALVIFLRHSAGAIPFPLPWPIAPAIAAAGAGVGVPHVRD